MERLTDQIKTQIRKEALEEMVKEFILNYSYTLLSTVQDARVGMDVYEVKRNKFQVKEMVKHKEHYYWKPFTKFFIVCQGLELVEEFERRMTQEELLQRKFNKYELIPLSEFNKYYEYSFDMYFNGKKIPLNEIEIVFTDYHTILCIPYKYEFFTTMHIVRRNYYLDLQSNKTNSFKISTLTYPNVSTFGWFCYVDGLFTTDFTKQKVGTDYVITVNAPVGKMIEVNCMPALLQSQTLTKGTKHFRLQRKVKGKREYRYPVHVENVMIFANGLYTDLGVTAITSDVFRINPLPVDKATAMIFYEEQAGEAHDYRDHVLWYDTDHGKDLVSDLDNNKVPEYITKFKLSNVDTSAQNLVDSKLNDTEWRAKKLKEITNYDYEFYGKYIDAVTRRAKITESKFVDMSKMDYAKATRNNNRSDVWDTAKLKDFDQPYILVSIPNPESFGFNVFVDGIRDDEPLIYHQNDETLVYIRASRVSPKSIIEFEMMYVNDKLQVRDITVVANQRFFVIGYNEFLDIDYLKLFMYDATKKKYYPFSGWSPMVYPDRTDGMLAQTYPGNIVLKAVNTFVHTFTRYVVPGKTTRVLVDGSLEMAHLNHDKENYRIYKNGRTLPHYCWSVEFPTLMNDLTTPKFTINAAFTIGEVIYIEYMPFQQKAAYDEKLVEEYGRVRPNKGVLEAPFNDNIMTYYLNGRRISHRYHEIPTNNGLQLWNVNSRKHFNMYLNRNSYKLVSEFSQNYNVGPDLYDVYLKSLMVGELIKDEEPDVTGPDMIGMIDLYYDLYREYLKHNIIDASKEMPKYISFKYSKMITKPQNVIYVDMTEKQTRYMPLDPTIQHTGEDFITVGDEYYQVLSDFETLPSFDLANIPKDLYEKYKDVFNNNVIVLDISAMAEAAKQQAQK